MSTEKDWPALSFDRSSEVYATLHMWTQVVGKICLQLTSRTNHFWNIAFQITSRGLATPLLRYQDRALTLTFDFIAHKLVIETSDGILESVALKPRTVADFYMDVIDTLRRMNIELRIWTMPVEVPNPIRFEADTTHRSYDPDVT